MSLKIADDDGTFEIQIPVERAVLEMLRIQVERLQANEGRQSRALNALGLRVTSVITEMVDPDLRPPTQAQVDYAIAIARELNVNLPGEALMCRGAMGEFLDRFSDLFKARRRKPISDQE